MRLRFATRDTVCQPPPEQPHLAQCIAASLLHLAHHRQHASAPLAQPTARMRSAQPSDEAQHLTFVSARASSYSRKACSHVCCAHSSSGPNYANSRLACLGLQHFAAMGFLLIRVQKATECQTARDVDSVVHCHLSCRRDSDRSRTRQSSQLSLHPD